eukprot:scaffold288373_cov15-Tisochrysis_lutea.AAC.3
MEAYGKRSKHSQLPGGVPRRLGPLGGHPPRHRCAGVALVFNHAHDLTLLLGGLHSSQGLVGPGRHEGTPCRQEGRQAGMRVRACVSVCWQEGEPIKAETGT